MLQFIQEHYDKELTLEQIAKSALISKSECLRCFRQTFPEYTFRAAAKETGMKDNGIEAAGRTIGFSDGMQDVGINKNAFSFCQCVQFISQLYFHSPIQHIQLAWNTCVEEPAGYEFHTWHSLSEIILSLVQHQPLSSDISSKKILL